jgi:hypothetical protein
MVKYNILNIKNGTAILLGSAEKAKVKKVIEDMPKSFKESSKESQKHLDELANSRVENFSSISIGNVLTLQKPSLVFKQLLLVTFLFRDTLLRSLRTLLLVFVFLQDYIQFFLRICCISRFAYIRQVRFSNFYIGRFAYILQVLFANFYISRFAYILQVLFHIIPVPVPNQSSFYSFLFKSKKYMTYEKGINQSLGFNLI